MTGRLAKGGVLVRIKQIGLQAIAVLLLIVGLITLPLPIPLGVPCLSLSLLIFVATNRRAASLLRALRKRSDRLNGWLNWIEEKAGERIATILKKTRRRGPNTPPPSDD